MINTVPHLTHSSTLAFLKEETTEKNPKESELYKLLQDDKKNQAIHRLGLSSIPSLAKSTPKRNSKELETELANYNPDVRIKSTSICQGNIIDLIRKLHESL